MKLEERGPWIAGLVRRVIQRLNRAERGGQLDQQSLAVESIGMLIGRSSIVAGKLP